MACCLSVKIKRTQSFESEKTDVYSNGTMPETVRSEAASISLVCPDIDGDNQSRISTSANSKYNDDNANIADLSDKYRPSKLAEKYLQLYENEWSGAYGQLFKNGETEEDICRNLLKALCITYRICKDKANKGTEEITKAMKSFLGGNEPDAKVMEQIKDQRKSKFRGHTRMLKKALKPFVKNLFTDEIRKDPQMDIFLKESIKLCWLMVIQDPPVFIDVNIERSGEMYDSSSLRPHIMSGKYIDYIVWPTLFLEKGGSILCKGIAHCKDI